MGSATLAAVLMAASAALCEAPAALIAGVSGAARLARPGAPPAPAAVGSALHPGDSVVVDEGTAQVIELSGRLVTVTEQAAYVAPASSSGGVGLLARLGDAVAEIVGPQSQDDGPVVHGMARDLGRLAGARPAATKVRDAHFEFGWEAPEGVTQFDFTLERDGGVVARRRLGSPAVAPGSLGVGPGLYYWEAQAVGPIARLTTGRRWVQVVGTEESRRIDTLLAQVRARFSDPAAAVVAGVALYVEGYFDEAARVTAGDGLPPLAVQVHLAALARMGREVAAPGAGTPE